MNCKPGDLAIVVRDDFLENIGALVEVVGPAGAGFDYPVPTGAGQDWATRPTRPIRAWDDDFTSSMSRPGSLVSFEDGDLRPIRDQPGADETLTWAGLPASLKTTEPA